MKQMPRITVAPNGARLQKSHHSAVPFSTQELARTARACQSAGADCIHLHVRDAKGAHSLDPDHYRLAMQAVSNAAPGMRVQITTEAAGRYDVGAQLNVLRELRPAAASISIREIARSPKLAKQVYQTARDQGTEVQHILYGIPCLDQLTDWVAQGIVACDMRDAIVVLGQYAPPRAGDPDDLTVFLEHARNQSLRLTVCAFGHHEQACLLAAARSGCDVRVGFENNLYAPDGTVWQDNAQAVTSLKEALETQQSKLAS